MCVSCDKTNNITSMVFERRLQCSNTKLATQVLSIHLLLSCKGAIATCSQRKIYKEEKSLVLSTGRR